MSSFITLSKIPGNSTCADCGFPECKWVSVNNGVFICSTCSTTHKDLGVKVSFVLPIASDKWSDHRIKFLSTGGNERFRAVVNKHNIQDLPIPKKYNTREVEWYRNLLKAEIEETKRPEEPPVRLTQSAKLPSMKPPLIKREFSHKHKKTWVDMIKGTATEARRGIQQTAKNFKRTASAVIDKVGNTIVDTSTSISSEIFAEPVNFIQETASNLMFRAVCSMSPRTRRCSQDFTRNNTH